MAEYSKESLGKGTLLEPRPLTQSGMTGRLLIARLHRLCCAAVTNRLYFHISAPKMTKRIINTGDAPAAIGPYSQGVMVANTLYLSGQIGLDPKVSYIIFCYNSGLPSPLTKL